MKARHIYTVKAELDQAEARLDRMYSKKRPLGELAEALDELLEAERKVNRLRAEFERALLARG